MESHSTARSPPCHSVGGRRLPERASALIHHLGEQAQHIPSENNAQRLIRFVKCLLPRFAEDADAPRPLGIDLNVVRHLCGDGVPDDNPALRAAVWKVLLGYLPPDLFQWDSAFESARASYKGFVEELYELFNDNLSSPQEDTEQPALSSAAGGEGVREGGSLRSTLRGTLGQIAKDVVRTRNELDFFARSIEDGGASGASDGCIDRDPDSINVFQPRFHRDVLARVLLVFARLNLGILYVQGMNELCACFYYAFAQDPLESGDSEADAFFCFSLMMANKRDEFMMSLDNSDNGMLGMIDKFSDLLRVKDAEVWAHLDAQRVSPSFYTVRWLTLMLAQELEMPDTLRLWDSLLSDFARPHPMLLYTCVAMVMHVREVLLAGDFTDCMRLLQHYPPVPIEEILQAALKLRAPDLAPAGASNLDIERAKASSPIVGPAAIIAEKLSRWRHF